MDRLREFQTVTLNVPRDGPHRPPRDFCCSVLALQGSSVVLQPTEDLIGHVASRVEHVLLAFEHHGMLVGLKGVLAPDGHLLRFTVEDGVQVARRRSTRLKADLPISVLTGRAGESACGVTRDISTDGVLAAVDITVAIGDHVEVTVQVPGEAPFRTRGQVVRQAPGLFAVQFERPAPMGSPLARYIVAGKEAERRASRPASAGPMPRGSG